jgi:hypothetical protein
LTSRCRRFAVLFHRPGNIPGLPVFALLTTTTPSSAKTLAKHPGNKVSRLKYPAVESGSIEVFYLKEFPELDEGPFMKEERDLIDNFANLISGSLTKDLLRKLMTENSERLKELRGINQISNILKQERKPRRRFEGDLQYTARCMAISRIHCSAHYLRQPGLHFKLFLQNKVGHCARHFETQTGKKGIIEVYYLKDFPMRDEGPFLNEERNLIDNLADIISGIAAKKLLSKLLTDNTERIKELEAINKTTAIISAGKTVEETLQEICDILPLSWQYPEQTVARITFEDIVVVSRPFNETIWRQIESFVTIDNKKGWIEIFYLNEFPKSL